MECRNVCRQFKTSGKRARAREGAGRAARIPREGPPANLEPRGDSESDSEARMRRGARSLRRSRRPNVPCALYTGLKEKSPVRFITRRNAHEHEEPA